MGYSYFDKPYSEGDRESKVSLRYLRTAVCQSKSYGKTLDRVYLTIE
jgi:hypothetical protein